MKRRCGAWMPALVASMFTMAAEAAPADLFFSEYVEGSSNNKALEIYNGTAAPIDLSVGQYKVQIYVKESLNNTL
ncbi:MAG: lamin tail domain-containing protein [Lysobacterales bacterium]